MMIRVPDKKGAETRAALDFVCDNLERTTGLSVTRGQAAHVAITRYAASIGGDLPDWYGGTLANPNTPAGAAKVIKDAADQGEALTATTRKRVNRGGAKLRSRHRGRLR